MKLDPTVKKEVSYIAFWVTVFSIFTQAVFLVIGKWDYTVLLGNLLSGSAAVLNFLLMGITVQNAVLKEDKQAKNMIKVSQSLRLLGLFVVAAIGLTFPIFNIWTVLIPLIFPRIAIAIRPIFTKK